MRFSQIIKYCEICKKCLVLKSQRDVRRKRYCSKICRRKGCGEITKRRMAMGEIPKPPRRPKPLDRFCSECDKEIGQQTKGRLCLSCFNKTKYCSQIMHCDYCDQILERAPNRIKSQSNHFCSYECHSRWKQIQPSAALVEMVCEQCGEKTARFRSQFQGKHVFCSGKCAGCFYGKRRRGESTLDLRRAIKAIWNYKQWAYSVRKAANFRCQNCNLHKPLHAHHKIPFAQIFKDFLSFYSYLHPVIDKKHLLELACNYIPFWDVGNGEALCADCHADCHPEIRLISGKSNALSQTETE